jgi:(1->4)-alpha-D-glucan 1-alpha-D-glucosylmutase
MSGDLDRLCARCGVAIEYSDLWGNRCRASDTTRIRVLQAMGVALDSAADAGAALAAIEDTAWREILPPVKVARADAIPLPIEITLPAGRAATVHAWALELESGERKSGTLRPDALPQVASAESAGTTYIRVTFELPAAVPCGYHRFTLAADARPAAAMRLIVCPGRCYQPPVLTRGERVWGPAIQLYALKSERNWGIGDFGDLEKAAEFTAGAGAGIVGVNPLHALFPSHPHEASPYRPSSRSRLNVLYLDVEAIPDFGECRAALDLVGTPEFQARLAALRTAGLVDYTGVAACKFEVLELLYGSFRERHLAGDSERARAFRAFQAGGGERLRLHAVFEALQQHFSREDGTVWGWPAWPEEYRNPESAAVAAFARDRSERVEYFLYLQWLADAQLGGIARRASAGLPLGLFEDLAVGVSPGGSETWIEPGLHALSARIGCPPDDFNLKGQEWGLPPWIPQRLVAAAYEPFAATLRELMRHAGTLRIDHVMGLMRLYWIPAGAGAEEGTYVGYPFSDLLGILALESERNRCLVIGEDLGTVPDAVRAAMAEYGILAYRPMYFERAAGGEFKPPAEYMRDAAVVITTHDLPTLRGYWLGDDLATRSVLGLFPGTELRARQYEERERARWLLLAALEREGLLPGGSAPALAATQSMDDALVRAVHAFVARAPSKILMIQLEDLLGQVEQVNLPGTTDERHPNWRRKLPANVEDWTKDERVRALLEVLRMERG